jgi:4-alpha-glucanotransferase
LGHLPFIAEDLGIITPDVVALRDEFELPGIRVFQFGFDANPGNPHLTHNYVPNTVAYTGTHDNNTTRGWFKSLPENARQAVRSHAGTGESFPRNSRFESPNHVDKCMLHMQQWLVQDNIEVHGEVAWTFIQSVWSSKAGLAIAPLQDLLNLGGKSFRRLSLRCIWITAMNKPAMSALRPASSAARSKLSDRHELDP